MRSRIVLVAAVLVNATCAPRACTGSGRDRANGDGGTGARPAESTLVLGTTEEPDTLDPLFTEIAGAQEIVRLLFRDLTDYDPDWEVRAALAEARPTIATSTSGAPRARWRLLPGARWSDGAPLTAHDVVRGYQLASNPLLETTFHRVASEIGWIEVVSDREFVVMWRRPFALVDAPRLHPIVPSHAYPDPGAARQIFQRFGRAPISNGPYRLRDWQPGQYLRLERNPSWAGRRPEIDVISWRFFKSEDAFEAELRTGGIDALGEASGLSVDRGEGLAQRLRDTHVVEYTDSGLWLQIAARSDHPATSDRRVREAFSRALDRVVMAELVYGGRAQATPAYGCFPPRHRAHSAEIPPIELDLAAARALLDEAGWASTDGARGRVRRGSSEKLELKLQFASGSQASERAAAYVKAQLEKIGAELSLEALPLRILFGRMREKSHAPLVLFAWRSGPDWDASSMLRSDGRQNYGGFRDAEVDRLLDTARGAEDPERWAALLAEVETRYRASLPSIPLLFRKAVSVRPRRLLGWRPTGTTTPITWNAEEWRFEGSSGAR